MVCVARNVHGEPRHCQGVVYTLSGLHGWSHRQRLVGDAVEELPEQIAPIDEHASEVISGANGSLLSPKDPLYIINGFTQLALRLLVNRVKE